MVLIWAWIGGLGPAALQPVLERMAAHVKADGVDTWAHTLCMPRDQCAEPEGVGGYLLHKCTVIHSEQAKAWAEYASWYSGPLYGPTRAVQELRY